MRFIFCLLATLALPAVATTAEPASDTIVVTASRVPVATTVAGSSITVITREEISQRQAVFAADLVAGVPGVALSRAGGIGSQTQVRVRGAEANQVLVLIDGVEANDPAGNGEFGFEYLTTFDIERIEVVRGPQSALWGSDALAGVINVITRRPAEELLVEGFAEGGSFATYHGGGRIAGQLGGVRIGATASRLDSDGTNIARTGAERDGYENSTATLTLGGTPRDNLELEFFGRYTSATRDFDSDFSSGLPGDSNALSEVELGFYRASGALTLLDGRWLNSLRGTLATSDTRVFEDGLPDGSYGADRMGLYLQSSLALGPAGVPGSGPGLAGTITLAVDGEREEFRQRGSSPWGDPNQEQAMNNLGVALEYLVEALPGVNVSLGGRQDFNSDFRDVATWRSTVSWQVAGTGTRWRGSYGTGQKAPTFIERFGFFPDQFVGNPALRPEESRGWEAGVDQELLAGRLSLGATYFRERLEEEINGFVFFFDEDSGSFAATAANLPGTSHRRGVELTGRARTGPGLTFVASYTYVDADQPDPVSGAPVREIRRPFHLGSLNGNWSSPGGRANLNVDIRYTGQRTDNFFPVEPPFDTQTVRLDAYTLLTLALSYQLTPRLQTWARVENLLDEDYEDVLGYRTPGIGAYLGFRASLSR